MQCVVLAAGEGKRMRPLTARRPKVMLPIANRPMMEHLILAARDAGVTDFIIVVGYFEREIRNHFGDGSNFGVNITYVTQRHQLGTGDALRTTAGMVNDRFLLLNGDMVLRRDDIKHLCLMDAPCMGVHETDHPQDYGVVTVEGIVSPVLKRSQNTQRALWSTRVPTSSTLISLTSSRESRYQVEVSTS